MVGLDLYLLRLALLAWVEPDRFSQFPILAVVPVASFAWIASALAGDHSFRWWMFPVKWVAVMLFGFYGGLTLAFGFPDNWPQGLFVALTSLWTAWVFGLPPRKGWPPPSSP